MDWSESWVRKQAGWQAFKRGAELAAAGAASSFREKGGLRSGLFRAGKRSIRCVVRHEGAHLAVECGCSANRRSGEICEHGVALALMQPVRAAEPVPEKPRTPATPVDRLEPTAYRIFLPPRCADMLAAGRLQVRLEACDEPLGAPDLAFAAFLSREGVADAKLLQFRGETAISALQALAGHPRVQVEDGSRTIEIADRTLEPLPLKHSSADRDEVRLEVVALGVRLIDWGGKIGAVIDDGSVLQIGRLPVEAPSAAWRGRVAELFEKNALKLSKQVFLNDIEAWLDLFRSPAPGWLGELHFEALRPDLRLELEGSLNALDATIRLSYADGPLALDADEAASALPRIEDGRVQVRDREREAALARRLEQGGWRGTESGHYQLRDPDEIPLWLTDEVPAIRDFAEVKIGERLRHVMQRLHVVSPQVELAEGAGLACEISFQTSDGKLLDPAKIRGILRKGNRSAKTRDGSVVVVRREISEELEPLLADLGLVSQDQRFAITKAQALLLQEFREKTSKQLQNNEEEGKGRSLPAGLVEAALRDYQEQGVCWLHARINELSGALLGDEMGLGKTIQSIALMQWMKRSMGSLRVLVLVPTSLVGSWEDELARFAPGLRVCRFTGSARDGRRGEAEEAEVLLTSYGTFQRDRAFHLGRRYQLAICDEASLLRNPDSQLSRAVAKLDAERRLALSGTPIENRLEDLWSIFRFVAPGYLGARKGFSERYEGDASGPAARRRLALRISPYYLRRTKRDVAKDLPDKLVIDEWLDLSSEARSLYRSVATAGLEQLESMESEGAARMHLLTVLLRLRQICLSPSLVDERQRAEAAKVEWLKQLLEAKVEENGKTLVFSQFAGFLRELERSEDLPADQVFRLDGATRNRAELVERFQKYEGSAVFLISLKAGGYGLNLTAADTVVHMDPWWNPAVENQATDRAHRIGQTRPVTVYRLLARDTVEERVRRIQEQKRGLMSVAEGGTAEEAGERWSEADLRQLLS